jgi:Fe-S-cluster containining protein
MDGPETLPAGEFSTWLAEMKAALRGEHDMDVPCNGCTACCTSSQFVHVGPNETDTLARIPRTLLFPAPGLPSGNVVLGYDEHGRCPMLIDGHCSIYEHRPRTCRTYDCRIFAATSTEVDEDDVTKAEVGARARRWRFDFSTEHDRVLHDAVQAAARFAREREGNATESAVLAIRLVHDRV